ncbi:hypothetical protein AVEN_186370-1 [Araneus ventricosus]|uniref:Uncharacterized protein n=1 Tax=Araneus ventricosus TaxID=182803 RepID=A0A4Y2RUF7_ARAVE|nr:hypothetical protein AVEN_227250-1 [Araneus ventricosus]GBN79520.1 hypothetical protein AVEN_186370-1 [Araneus ventricosus]
MCSTPLYSLLKNISKSLDDVKDRNFLHQNSVRNNKFMFCDLFLDTSDVMNGTITVLLLRLSDKVLSSQKIHIRDDVVIQNEGTGHKHYLGIEL